MEKKFNISVFVISGVLILALIFMPLTFSAQMSARFYDDYWVYLTALIVNLVAGIFSATLLAVLIDIISYRKSVKKLLLDFFDKANGIQKTACTAFDATAVHHLSAQIKAFLEWHEKTAVNINKKKNPIVAQITEKINLILKKTEEIKDICGEIQAREKELIETKDNMLYFMHNSFVLSKDKNLQDDSDEYQKNLTSCAAVKDALQALYPKIEQSADGLSELLSDFYSYTGGKKMLD